MLDRQAQGQAQLIERLPGQQWTNIVVGVEIDLEVLGQLGPPLRPATGAITISGQGSQRIGIAVELRRLGTELQHLLALGCQLQEQAGAIGLLDAVEGGQALGQLLARGKRPRVALFTEDFVCPLDQLAGTDDVLQGG
ncbi:hypothetical protein D3C85_1365450 [compost metagenome]